MTLNTATSPTGPFLVSALLCEKVLKEQDGNISLIRVIDRITRLATGPDPQKEMQPFDWEGNLIIGLKKGSAQGSMTLKMELVKPSMEKAPPLEQTVYFEGDEDHGVLCHITVKIKVQMPGLYWFKLFLDDKFLTQVPLRIIYLRQVIQPGKTQQTH